MAHLPNKTYKVQTLAQKLASMDNWEQLQVGGILSAISFLRRQYPTNSTLFKAEFEIREFKAQLKCQHAFNKDQRKTLAKSVKENTK